jgi:hypothetical protein
VTRLQKLLPKVGSLKVQVGGWHWRPEDPLPKAEVLKKAKLWTGDDLQWLRDVLASPPLRVDVSETDESHKLETAFGNTLHVLKKDAGLPRTVLKIPFCLCLIDARSMSVEDTDVLLSVPGRARFAEVPTFIIGGVAETDDQKHAVQKACGHEWVGEQRSVDVFTGETSIAYLATRRRLHMMLPEGCHGKKLPPVLNLTTAQPLNLGWAATVGLFRSMWKETKARSEEGKVDWIYVLSDDLDLPVLLSQRIDSHPSIVFCCLSAALSTEDVAAKLREKLKTVHETPPLP